MKSGKDYIGVGCGAIVINDNDEILLVKRSKNARTEPGMWSRPGGEVEFGEYGSEAVEREIFEETGVKVKIIRPLEFTENLSEDKSSHWIALGYLAKYVSGTPSNKEPSKHDEVRWFPLNKLPDNLTSYTKNSLHAYKISSKT